MTFRQQMLEFTNYLARCFIVSEIRFGNIGMDDHYKPKYFLDLNIHISEACDKDSLRDYYHGIIDTIFMPFIHKNRSPHKAKPYQLVPCNTSTMHVRETDSEPTVKKYSVGNMQIPSAKQKLINLNNRIDDIKSRIRNFDSEDSSSRKKLDTADACKVREITMLKRPSVIQFGMTEKSKQLLRPGTEPRGKQFYSNVFKSMQEDTPFFDILANPFKARPNRKNESLKEKEYLQMVRSKDGYFKDFFKVLEDQPSDIKALMPNILREKVKEPPAIL